MKNTFGNILLSITCILNAAILLVVFCGNGTLAFGSWINPEPASKRTLGSIVDNMEGGKVLSAYTEPEEANFVTIIEVESAMSQIGEITTVAYEYEGIAFDSDCNKFISWNMEFTRNSIEVDYEGVIRAGYTISDISIDINQDEMIIYITLPEAQVFSNEITEQEVTYDNNWLNHIDPDVATELVEEAKEDELNEAIENGLFEEAETNAKSVIGDVLSVFEDYEVVFVTAN